MHTKSSIPTNNKTKKIVTKTVVKNVQIVIRNTDTDKKIKRIKKWRWYWLHLGWINTQKITRNIISCANIGKLNNKKNRV